MTEGALKAGRGLESNSMLLIERGTCTVVENIYLHLDAIKEKEKSSKRQ